jgi:2'-5' RNA ligase
VNYQTKQLELIKKIEESLKNGQQISTLVDPVSDYVNDNRICLTSVVFLPKDLQEKIISCIINPLKETDPDQYFYIPDSFHVTINNIRTIENPPLFNNDDLEKAQKVFRKVVSKYHSFSFELKGIFELPTSLAIPAFSDETLGNLVLELRSELKKAGVPDNKTYADDNIVIGSTTIARFTKTPNSRFKQKVDTLKETEIGNFEVVKISLITTNAACHPSKTKIIDDYLLS